MYSGKWLGEPLTMRLIVQTHKHIICITRAILCAMSAKHRDDIEQQHRTQASKGSKCYVRAVAMSVAAKMK